MFFLRILRISKNKQLIIIQDVRRKENIKMYMIEPSNCNKKTSAKSNLRYDIHPSTHHPSIYPSIPQDLTIKLRFQFVLTENFSLISQPTN